MSEEARQCDYAWMGRPIAELSREELERAFVQLALQLRAQQEPEAIRAAALGRVEMLKRGELNG